MTKLWLNFGCGKIILPSDRPGHHWMVDDDVYAPGRKWVNADKVPRDGAEVVSMTEYPFPWQDDYFAGVLLTHVVEHIPHEITTIAAGGHWADDWDACAARRDEIRDMQDGWYAFWSELYRVCEHGAVAHVLSPYGWSTGAIADPTHTRMIVEQTFTHQLAPEPRNSFTYVADCNWRLVEPCKFHITEPFEHLAKTEELFRYALATQVNVAHNIYAKLRCVKDNDNP